jgi:hypothetical protein
MKCQKCVANGLRSRVHVGMSTSTLMGWTPYYDEDGEFHNDDPNIHSTDYSCTQGHSWSVSSQRGKETIRYDDDSISA